MNESRRQTAAPVATSDYSKFPVHWEQAGDEELFWTFDPYHTPEPVKVMDFDVYRRMSPAADRAWDAYGMPQRGAWRRINGYVYGASRWAIEDASDLEGQLGRSQAILEQAMPHQEEMWRGTYLPELESHLAFWKEFDLGRAAMPRLLAHLDETLARWERMWGEIHLLVFLPALGAIATFEELYRELFPDDDTFQAYRLLQGFRNKTVEVGDALWELSRTAASEPEVRRALEESGPSGVMAALEQTDVGRQFRGALNAYLQEYGRRSDRLEASHPSWIEDPTPVIVNLKDYVGQPERDRETEQAVRVTERERVVAEARARLVLYPQVLRDRFEYLLTSAQVGNVLQDDHPYWIDFGGLYYVRQVILEFGRRFASSGVLDRAGDVFHLSVDELRDTAASLPTIDRRRLVGAREAEIAYFRTIAPPAGLGTPPSAPPPDLPLFKGLAKYGGGLPAAESATLSKDVVIGNAGSPGVARGIARVVRTLSDASSLRRGEVLVAVATSPSWTPLFATAAAIVTDSGGVLSHAAIVAREYGIPAVVGTGNGSARIADGQLVTVDGSSGTVLLMGENR